MISEKEFRLWAAEACEEAKQEIEKADFTDLEVNALSAVGNLASSVIRRRVLLKLLARFDWCLSDVSDALGMGGASNVTSALVQLGLHEELRAAKRAGKARQGVRHQSTKKEEGQ